MGSIVQAGKTSEFKDGTMRKVIAEGREILVARVGDKYYAADNRCTHMGGDLSLGKLGGTVVTCPRHGSQFDLTDGHVARWTDWSGVVAAMSKVIRAPRPIATYPVKVEEDTVRIEI